MVRPGTPALSVIIASVNGLPMITECLSSLAPQRHDVDVEVIVVDATSSQTVEAIRQQFPWVKLITYRERLSIPALRAEGFAQSTGHVVVILEDHCIVPSQWMQRVVETHRRHPECAVVGGAIENGSRNSLIDWAVFFCEYAAFMLPLPAGQADSVPGNNVSYKRAVLEGDPAVADALHRGFWETTVHPRLRHRGERFLLDPSIVVFHKKHFGVRYFLGQRYHYSRYYAGTVTRGFGIAARGFRAAASLALPPLLVGRIVARVVRKRRNLRELALAGPLLGMFATAWAVGECIGCLAGPGGSLVRVE